MQGLSASEQVSITEFHKCCSDLVSAKLILAEAKLGLVLKTLAQSSVLVNAVAESLADFSFDVELNKAVVKNQLRTIGFRMPFESNKIIALAFNLLSEFDSKRMDLHKFIFDYFGGEDVSAGVCFTKFVQAVVIPFRDELCALIGFEPQVKESYVREQIMLVDLDNSYGETTDLNDDIETYTQIEQGDIVQEYGYEQNNTADELELDYVQTFFYDLAVILGDMSDVVNCDRRVAADRKDEINITIDAIMKACELESLKIINALLISLNYLLHKVKGTKYLNIKLQDRVAEFYDFLPQ